MENSAFPNLKLGKSDDEERSPGNKLQDYKIICELGRGSYGVVNKVISLVDNNEYVMKKINMKHIKLKHQKEALKEAQILRKVKHPNIIRYFTSFVDEENLYIIMEYAEGGDLAVLIKSYREKKKTFSEREVWDFAWELCNAVDYLHNNNIIHRDIKTLNIFLSRDRRIKLGDLGVSKIVSNAASLQGTRVGTPLYLSPELVKQLPYDYKVDIWALGCVIYHIAALEPPFYGDNLITLGYNIVHKYPKPLSNAFSPKISTIILKFLEKNPSARPKISDVFSLFPSRYSHGFKHSVSNLSDAPTISTSKDITNYMKAEDKLDKIESNKANVVKMLKSVEKQEPFQKNESEKEKFLPKKLITSNAQSIPIVPISPSSPKKINNFVSVTKSNLIRDEASIKRMNEPSKTIDSAALRDSIKTGSPILLKEKEDPFSKRQADTESTVENKPKNTQVITANIIGNDSTLSSKNIKEMESQRKNKQESNFIVEENPSKKQLIQEMPSKDEEDRLPTASPNLNGPSPKTETPVKAVRPQTSDPTKRIIASPIIKSTSPRIPIKGTVKIVNSELIAEKPPLSKQENIQSLPTEIRIRPVSANLIKRANIPTTIQQPLLSNVVMESEYYSKPDTNSKSDLNAKPIMKKTENNMDFDAIEAKLFPDQKSKAPLLERPKSAIFLNRIQTIANKMDHDENAKIANLNKLGELNDKFKELSKSNASQKVKFLVNSSGFDSFKNVQRAQNKSPYILGGASLDDKEMEDPDLRTKQSWSRFEYLKSENAGPKVESRVTTIEPKVLSEASRPKTSTSNKRKLTIHDLA